MATFPSSTTYECNDTIAPRSQGENDFFQIEKSFDLTTLLSAVLANADVVNLFSLPANYVIHGASLIVDTAGTKDATTFTLQLREGSTALSAALDMTAKGFAVGGNGTYNLPLSVGTSAVAINVVAVVSGGNAVSTKNPVIRVKLLVANMA